MNKVIHIIGWSSGLITIASAGVALIWFFFGLNTRIETLESQMQAIYQSASTGNRNNILENKENATSSQASINYNKMQNLVDTCATLALRVADAYDKGSSLSVAQPLEKMMDKLGCNNVNK